MDVLEKMVFTMPEEQYEQLLEELGGTKNERNNLLLSYIRKHGSEPENFHIQLGLSKGAYTTHKSRLLKKISGLLGKLDNNKLSQLKEETAQLSQLALQNERDVALRILYDMEKKLKEYDLPSELATIYKLLARLNRFFPSYEHYEMEYKKNIAYSLAITKAEDRLYDFVYYLSYSYLTKSGEYKDEIKLQLPELESISKLYPSHRLFVIYNIAKIYHDCAFLPPKEIALQEIEIEKTLFQFNEIFGRYTEDAFYQNLKYLVPFLFFEFYVRIDNRVKANHYLQQINAVIPRVAHQQLWPFFITQMINSMVYKLTVDGEVDFIFETEERLKKFYFPNSDETPHYICYYRFRAIAAFYNGQYATAAKLINDLRNTISLKQFLIIETEMKLFQAFLYALQNDSELAERFLSSAKRLVIDNETLKPLVKLFGKIISLLIKHANNGNEKENIIKYWRRFKSANNNKLLHYLRLSLIKI